MQRYCVGTFSKCGWKESTSCLNSARHRRGDNGGWVNLVEDRRKLNAEGFSLRKAIVGQGRVAQVISAIDANQCAFAYMT